MFSAVLSWPRLLLFLFLLRRCLSFHASAAYFGIKFFEHLDRYFPPGAPLRILEVGSRNVNGGLRRYAAAGWNYVSIDVEHGDGVDLVLNDPYQYPFESSSFDVTISSSAFEHVDFFWVAFLEMLRVTKGSGFVYLNMPADLGDHSEEVKPDSWRFLRDAGESLEAWGRRSNFLNLRLLQGFVSGHTVYQYHSDTILIYAVDAAVHDLISSLQIPQALPESFDELFDYVLHRNPCFRALGNSSSQDRESFKIGSFTLDLPTFCCKAPELILASVTSLEDARSWAANHSDILSTHRVHCLPADRTWTLSDCCSL